MEFGPTDDCKACEAIAQGRKAGNHIRGCRERFEAAMTSDEQYRAVIQRRDRRQRDGEDTGEKEESDDGEPARKQQRVIEEPTESPMLSDEAASVW